MKRFSTFVGALFALTLCLMGTARPAQAQIADQTAEFAKDWTLRLGFFIPNSETTRRAMGNVGFSGIVERRVYQTKDYDMMLGMGYNGMDRVYSIPLMFNFIYHRHNIRYGFGFGYSFNKRPSGAGSNGIVLGLLAGYRLTAGRTLMNVDLRYNFVGGSNNELDGASVTLGINF